MARRIFDVSNLALAATADNTAIGNNAHMTIKGGSTTQLNKIRSIYIGGLASSTSSPMLICFARNSTLGVSPTGLGAGAHDGPKYPNATALASVVVAYNAAGTGPFRDVASTNARINLTMNGYGGVVEHQEPLEDAYSLIGNAVSVGEGSLSAFTGGTASAVGAHIEYEPF